jgi:hypothetical protein
VLRRDGGLELIGKRSHEAVAHLLVGSDWESGKRDEVVDIGKAAALLVVTRA